MLAVGVLKLWPKYFWGLVILKVRLEFKRPMSESSGLWVGWRGAPCVMSSPLPSGSAPHYLGLTLPEPMRTASQGECCTTLTERPQAKPLYREKGFGNAGPRYVERPPACWVAGTQMGPLVDWGGPRCPRLLGRLHAMGTGGKNK